MSAHPPDKETVIAVGGLLAAFVFAWARLRNAFPAGKGDMRRLEDRLERLADGVENNGGELRRLNERVAKIEGWIDAQRHRGPAE